MNGNSIQCIYASTLNDMLSEFHGEVSYFLMHDGTWYCKASGEQYTDKEFCNIAKELIERRCKHEGTECDYYDGRKRKF